MISNSSMHFQAHQEAISRPMRRNLSFTASIAHLLQPQLHHRIVRNLTTAITTTTTTTTESQQQRKSKTSKRLRKTPTQKVLREESSAKWLSSLSFDDCGRTAGLQTKEVVTGLELCAAADGLLQNEEVPQTECWVLGIDPDNGGALAMLKLEDSASPAQVYDVPTVQVLVGKRARRRLDTRSIVSLLCDLGVPKGSPAYIEESRPFPSDGKQGWWSCGFGYGLWIGILVSLGFSVIPIPSMVWKKHFDLAGRTSCKDDSRVIACDLFPDLSAQLKRKKDHGFCENAGML